MGDLILVGCGGAVGAMLRYLIGLIPTPGDFPLMTLCINFLGAVVIGLIAEAAQGNRLAPKSVLFLKTGVCGGFTTFSTFSLETVTLFQMGKWFSASAYIVLSVVGSFCGVLLGQMLYRWIFAV